MSDDTRPSGREWLMRGLFAVLVAALAVVVAVTLLASAEDAATTEGSGSGSNGAVGGVHPAWTSTASP